MELRPLLLAKELTGLLDGPLVIVHIHRPNRLVQLHVAHRIHLVIHVRQGAGLLGRSRRLVLLLSHHLPDPAEAQARADLPLLLKPMN
jgi:hypothetical protein